jgi:hypothetical protein
VFRGTGLTAGAVFGQPQSLIGYEADGAQLDREARLLFGYRTPASFHLLGHAFLPRTWARLVPSIEDDEVVNDPSYPYEVAAATMGLYNRNGTVFTAATTDWVRVVAGGEPSVQQITRNVLGRLKSRVSGRSVLGPVADAFSVGCYAGNDGFDHAIVAAAGGDIHELYWQSGQGVGQGVLASIPGALAVAGFQGSDGYQHAIVAATDGIHEIYWQSGQGVHQGVIGQVSIPIAVAGFTSADGVQHAIVAAGNGDIHEFYWGGGVGLHHEVIANIPSPRAVAGYFAAVDGRSHVIVSDATNRVHELYWLPAGAVGHGVIATFDHQVIGVGGHYTPADSQQHVVVAVGDGNIYELTWHSGDGVVRDVLPSMATPVRTSMALAVASYAAADGYQHAIVVGSDGTMHEVFWNA